MKVCHSQQMCPERNRENQQGWISPKLIQMGSLLLVLFKEQQSGRLQPTRFLQVHGNCVSKAGSLLLTWELMSTNWSNLLSSFSWEIMTTPAYIPIIIRPCWGNKTPNRSFQAHCCSGLVWFQICLSVLACDKLLQLNPGAVWPFQLTSA